MVEQNPESKSRLIAKLVWQLLKTDGPFETLADLTDVLKLRLKRLRIPWTPPEITDAYALIETNTALVLPSAPEQRAELPLPPRPVSEAEAKTLVAKMNLHAALKTMPSPRGTLRPTDRKPIDIDARVEHDDVEHDRY